MYDTSRCLQCGCCLEVCPNYKPMGVFGGAASLVPMSRDMLIEGKLSKNRKKIYRKDIFAGCGKSLACQDVCPVQLPIEDIMSHANGKTIF